jgi:hypothetical protein
MSEFTGVPDCTLVTANFFFNNATRSVEQCLENMKVLLEVPCYLIIYCNEPLFNIIQNYRNSKGLGPLTRYHVTTIEQCKTYEYAEKIKKNREAYWPTRDARAGLESHLVTSNKVHFVMNTMDEDPFKTTYFGWVDANLGPGGSKVSTKYNPTQFLHTLSNLQDKFCLHVLNVQDKRFKLDENKREFYQQYRWVVGGCLYTLPKRLRHILEAVYKSFERCTELGYGHAEEMFYLEILDEFYDDIHRSYGDYRHILHNFIRPTEGISYIYDYILCRYLGFEYWREAYDCASEVVKSYETFQMDMDYFMYFRFLFAQFKAASHYKKEEAVKLIVKMERLRKNPYFDQFFRNHQGEVRAAFSAFLTNSSKLTSRGI